MTESTSVREYGLLPELRRCCWYTIFGAFFLMIVSCWAQHFVGNRDGIKIAVGCIPFVVLAAAMIYPLRWKVRVDSHGLARRRVVWWDSWPWTDLASGRVEKLHPLSLYDPERPWWRRKLRLSTSEDLEEVVEAINEHYQLPPEPDVPETLSIKYGFRCWATFDHEGIHLKIRKTAHEYSWDDLREIHIIRIDPLRRDFASLLVTLPDREIELKLVTPQYQTVPTWRGATAEVINEFLLARVPTERVHISIAGEPLTKREHIEKELRELKQQRRALVVCVSIFTSLFVALSVWEALTDGILIPLSMAIMAALFVGPIYVFVFRSIAKKIEILRNS